MPTTFSIRTLSVGLIGVFLASSCPCFAASGEDASDLEKVGDVLQIALPLGGFLSTFVAGNPDGGRWDKQGTWQSAAHFALAWTTTYAWKGAASKLRPNESARSSFPSGHTMGAFAGATFIDRRYGKWFGIPAYTLAALTAYSRVESQWHFADDTVAGASVSLLWGAAVVNPQPQGTSIRPFFGGDGPGLLISVGGTQTPTPKERLRPTYWSYTFAFGPAFLIQNKVKSPASTGTGFDLAAFNKQDDPTTTAALEITRRIGKRHKVDVFYNPFESRDKGSFAESVVFQGVTFPADSVTQSAWRLHDLRARYRYGLVDSHGWGVDAGGGIMFQDTFVSLAQEAASASVEDIAFLPFLTAHVSYRFHPKFWFLVGGDGMKLSQDWMVDAVAVFTWRFHPRWEAAVGYQFYDREIATDELVNRVGFNIPYASVATLW